MLPVLKVVSRFKGLRGTPLDPFGHTAERRTERRLIGEYRELITSAADRLSDDNMTVVVRLADAASAIAGFGPIKDAGVVKFRAQVRELLNDLERVPEAASPAARALPAE
jgi:indolepyruvate ferredoxin oxidoreductase